MALQEVKPESSALNKSGRRTISVSVLMALVFGGLVGVSIFIVLAVSVYTNFTNTFSLLSESSLSMMTAMENRIGDQGKQAENVLESIKVAYEKDRLDIDNAEEQQVLFDTLMHAAPIVEGIFIYRVTGEKTGIIRRRDDSVETYIGNRLEDPELLQAMNVNASRAGTDILWGDPVTIHDVGYINLSIPLTKNEELKAVAVALIGTNAVNRVIGQLGEDNAMTVFVMDQAENLIAHSRKPLLFTKQSAYRLADFPDESLKELENAKIARPFRKATDAGIDILDTEGRDGTVFMLKDLEGYSKKPLILGAYVNKVDIGDEIFRAAMAAFVGFCMMIIAIIVAILIGNRLARPMKGISNAASHFSNFELDRFEPLPVSRVSEIDRQASALNALHTAITEFSQYVPKAVVKRLMDSGVEGTRSVERELTIMFTDIAGFTTLSERLDAIGTANLLNDHFETVCTAISETGGTVDKFMGDCVMAFWGAPNADNLHAIHGVEAAQKIASAVKQDNIKRIDEGTEPLRVRIGIHTGRVVVGNIGGAGRKNYTIVGDAVNVAQRLEQLGRDLPTSDDVLVLMSESTAQAVSGHVSTHCAGSWSLRGREQPISVFSLNQDVPTVTGKVIDIQSA